MAQTFAVFGRLYPERIGFVEEYTRRQVENEGLLREGADISTPVVPLGR